MGVGNYLSRPTTVLTPRFILLVPSAKIAEIFLLMASFVNVFITVTPMKYFVI